MGGRPNPDRSRACARGRTNQRGVRVACLFRTREGTQYLASVAVVWTEAIHHP